ncbi:MAG: anaerobic ribonucleoside-triphosphate reductase activating protein, partial [Deltaproteobacteria bacterium]|nr:anaerobic ribonucleoside-triphosphate reductase activating protein [Deltaproteobacteria bacterium]
MKIGGLQKVSLIDYPGKVGAVVFTQGCNFRCPYCHNPELVNPTLFREPIPEEDILAFLKTRRGKLDAVTVTGGEPTLQEGLSSFLQQIKDLGFLVKIDTNGSLPAMIGILLEKGLVDYFAMD